MICPISSTTRGANPPDGSSISNSRGADINARPIATICCSPPDSVRTICFCRSSNRGK